MTKYKILDILIKNKGNFISGETLSEKLTNHPMKKGEVSGVARVAGIMRMKKTSDIIPMCHPIFMSGCEIDFEIKEELGEIHIYSTAKTVGETGIEMEALTGVTTAALTIYDMCKSVDKRMVISDIHLLTKTGGKSGDFKF